MNTISKKTGLTFGYMLIAYYVVVNLLTFLIDYTQFVKAPLTVINMVVILILGISCIWITKRRLNNEITFKEGFSAYFIMIVVGFLANYITQYILFNYVNPEAKIVNNEYMLELTRTISQDLEIPADEFNNKLQEMSQNPDGNFSFKTLFYNYAQAVLGSSIIGLIISLTFRNKSEFSTLQR